MKRRNLKSQKGAISVFVMIAMLFFLVTIVGAYMISSRRAQTQSEALEMAQDKYYKEGEENVIYDSKIMSSSTTIPIYTKEQYWSIGENTAIEIDGKVYDFSSKDYEKYELQNDIIINIETDLKNSKFKDDLFYADKINKNGHEILYYYDEEYYLTKTYSDGSNEYSFGEGVAVLSASGTDFKNISTTVTDLNGEYYVFEKLIIIPEGLEVGDIVNYYPSGTYTWKAKYASSDLATDGTQDVALATGKKVTTGTQDMSITSCKIFSIDESKGMLELIPVKPTTKTVRVHGAQGYNNAVYLLNEACNSLYGNGKKITARSISLDDIEYRMTETALAEAHSYSNGTTTYGQQVASPHTTSKTYPVIYGKEYLSAVDGVTNTTGLGRSQQTKLIERTEDGATLGALTANTSLQPYQRYWLKFNEFLQTAFKGDGTGIDNVNYNLILPNGTNTKYWLATRVVSAWKSRSGFDVVSVEGGYIQVNYLFYSDESASVEHSNSLFPIVSVSTSFIKGNNEEGWSIE